ncbi:hypothetical protein EIP91_009794 [Steccherinum ochraceum]|uniref:BZIP domain-containing protein n=1 Tax=Steccherinum ochraceum TaxID=92696 RepID=A0A4R0RK04_9APHY|nr:hypothetical protein EIP91_009794 [Steccherinum ochraceum]
MLTCQPDLASGMGPSGHLLVPILHSNPDPLPIHLRYMTPLPSLTQASDPALSDDQSTTSSSPMAHTSADRPERSRNAKAQARHRAKRKAYIEQLEQTVTKLQSVLALSPEQVGSIPPPVVRIRELESENMGLRRENEVLRHQLEEKNALLRPDITRRTTIPSDDRRHDRDMKRRRTLDQHEDMYLSTHSPHIPSPPPPLLIPTTSQYPDTHSSSLHRQSSQVYSSYNPPMSYQLPPATPPDSSATSSPSAHSFSPLDQYPPSSTDRHQHTPPSSTHTVLPRFSQTMGQYDFVKIEEENYSHHGMAQSHSYSASLPSYHSGQASNGHWQQSYTSERA